MVRLTSLDSGSTAAGRASFVCSLAPTQLFSATNMVPEWPSDATLVHKRPLIKHQDEYFSPDPRVVACYARSALDNLIEERDPGYFRNSYAKGRHDADGLP